MDVHEQLNQLETTVRGARARPMSASCVVNRAEMLEMIARLRGALPANLDHAKAVLSERDAVLAAGRAQAERIVEDAREERERLIEQADVLAVARERAVTLVAQARSESTRLLADADGYVDRKLAEFEVFLGQVGSQVNNGRLRLTTRRQADLSHFQDEAKGAGLRDDGPADVPAASGPPHDSGVLGNQDPPDSGVLGNEDPPVAEVTAGAR